jgi:hypothetical protein
MQLTHHFEDLLKKAEKITSKYNQQPALLKKLPVAKRVFENTFHGDENIKDDSPTAWGD